MPFSYPKRLGHALLDLLYPLFCTLCGQKVSPDAGGLCASCLDRFVKNEPPFCPFCGEGSLLRPEPAFCPSCHGRPFVFDRAWAAFRYEGTVRDCLHHFKYREGKELAGPLGEALTRFAARHLPPEGIDAVVPVPLAPSRQRERGFNQAELLAKALSRTFRWELVKNALVRVRETVPQIALSREERRQNVEEAFRNRRENRLFGKRLLLIDDILTTGATVNACADALKETGAVSVCVLTLARGQGLS